MKKEIDAIRVKDIAQGGLTQGQQTQIARNEQRIMQVYVLPLHSFDFLKFLNHYNIVTWQTQLMEELESLEETLNESIQESMGARAGKVSRNKKKGNSEDEDDAGRLIFFHLEIYPLLYFHRIAHPRIKCFILN